MIIGVAGTAKNTGKTTTLCALIGEAYHRGRLPGVTGIGYDGEERDNVTLLPKPRITVHPGMIVTTSERCLSASTARLRAIRTTGYQTALGEVVICRVEESGLVVVAGPNKTTDLAAVSHQMLSLGAADLLVDGSLNRIAPMAVADRVVFATGGARSTDIQYLADESCAIENIFGHGIAEGDPPAITGIRMRSHELSVQAPASPVHGVREIARVLERVPGGLVEIVVPGLITADGLAVMCERLEQAGSYGVTLVFDDPFKMLLAGDPVRVGGLMERLHRIAAGVRYRRPSHLAAITFNPYYPAFDGTTYRAAALEAASGRAALAAALHTPVIDVQQDGAARLYDACFN
jgi:hypothetical protein